MNNEEQEKAWLEEYKNSIQKQNELMLNKHTDEINQFIKSCKAKDILLRNNNFSFIPTIGVVCEYPKILTKLNPNLIADKEGLFSWTDLSTTFETRTFNSGYFYSNSFIAMASPVFRRGMHGVNNWAPRFIDKFWELAFTTKNLEMYLGMDTNRVRVNIDSSSYAELDTWYGAPFNENIANIKDGVTHLRPPLELEERYLDLLFNGAYALDIIWNTKEKIKSIQILEFKGINHSITLNAEEHHPVRYLHAEFDLEKDEFRHVDGAVQYHTREEYLIRRDSNFRHNLKDDKKIKPNSVKVFKINGSVPVKMWTELVSHFFASNPLIHEYLCGDYPKAISEILQKIKSRDEKS